MADETQSTQAEGTAADGTAGGSTPAKNKKINKMTLKDLNSQIEAAEKNKLAGSKYYKQLLLRKKELEVTQV